MQLRSAVRRLLAERIYSLCLKFLLLLGVELLLSADNILTRFAMSFATVRSLPVPVHTYSMATEIRGRCREPGERWSAFFLCRKSTARNGRADGRWAFWNVDGHSIYLSGVAVALFSITPVNFTDIFLGLWWTNTAIPTVIINILWIPQDLPQKQEPLGLLTPRLFERKLKATCWHRLLQFGFCLVRIQ